MKSISDLLSKEYLGVYLKANSMIHIFRSLDGIFYPFCCRNNSHPHFIRPPQEVNGVTVGWMCSHCLHKLRKEEERRYEIEVARNDG